MEDLRIIRSDSVIELKEIGQGAYGTVTQAFHSELGEVAIKKVVAHRSKPKQLKKLKEEAKKLSQLKHANIVRLHGFIEEPEKCGIVLEFCKYGSLYDLIESCECSISLKIQFLYEVAKGMAHLHSQDPPVIHRDLKAANVLIGKDLHAKLADFGLSEWKTVVRSLSSGLPNGTVTHIPPEKWEDINFTMNTKCDVYSFGILIWELLLETAPFKDANEMQIQLAVKEGQRPSLQEFPDDAPPSLKSLTEKCWSQNPDERPSVYEIVQLLEEEFITKDSFTQTIQKDKLDLVQEMLNGMSVSHSMPTNMKISKNHSCRQLEATSPPATSPQATANGLEEDSAKELPKTLNTQLDLQSDSLMSNGSETSNGSANGQIPAVVADAQISLINQKVYSIVNQQLQNSVVTDSIPIDDLKSKSAPSVQYKRESSVPTKEFPQSDLPPSLKGERGKGSKQKSSRSKGTTTIIQKGTAGETVIHTTKVDGIQIGDRNVMYVGGGGGRGQGRRNVRSDPQQIQILKGKLSFEKTPLDTDSVELLCEHLGKYWKPLGRKLGFSDGQLEAIDHDYYKDGHKEVVHQMLREWKTREGMAATTYVIGNALIEIGRPGTASMLCKSSPAKKAMSK